MRWTGVAALFLGLVLVSSRADGFGGRGRGAGQIGWSGYPQSSCPMMAAPVWVMPAAIPAPLYASFPCPGVAPLAPRPVPLAPIPFAPPRPAPPSGTPEPPLGKSQEPPVGKSTSLASPELSKRAPAIVETRGPTLAPAVEKDKCKVGFWNVTGRDVEITVAGKNHRLAKDRALTLELERNFSWAIAGQPPATERVPEEKAFHEIILRE